MGSRVYQSLDSTTFQIRLLRLHPNGQTSQFPDPTFQTTPEQTESKLDASQASSTSAETIEAGIKYTISLVPDLVAKTEVLQLTTEDQHSFERPLAGVLETVSLESAPNFVALSYVWGSEIDKTPFILNGTEVRITKNLSIALRHLQQDIEQILLWIDALCIDQSNMVEKSEQVLRMRDIYAAAESVTVWLGPAADNSDLIMEFLDSTGKRLVANGQAVTSFYNDPNSVNIVNKEVEMNPHLKEVFRQLQMKTVVEALAALLARDWWYRAWVLQEFSTAGQVYFQCGKKRSRLDAFETTITLTTKLFYSTAYSFASTMMWTEFIQGQTIGAMAKSPTVNMAQSFFRERHHFQGAISKNQRKLVDLLLTFNAIGAADLRLRATDPKDKVYGMLGLARDAETLAIIPDYKMSVEAVYTDMTAKILANGGFQLLQLCGYGPHPELPSWVPELRNDIKQSPNDAGNIDKRFQASGTRKPSKYPKPLESKPNVLAAEGIRIDTVKETGDILTGLTSGTGDLKATFGPIHRFLIQIDAYLRQAAAMDSCPYGPTSKNIDEFEPEWFEPAQYRIPVSDREMEHPATASMVRATARSKTRCEALLTVIHTFNNLLTPDRDNRSGAATSLATVFLQNMGKFDLYLLVMYRNIGRRPFLTEKGYVGVGPEQIEKGDIAAVILGAELPYILRPADNLGGLVLIGDAYVHGAMDGEIIEKGLASETFEIA